MEIIYDKPTELNQFIGVGAFPLNFNNKYDEILAEFLRGLLVRRWYYSSSFYLNFLSINDKMLLEIMRGLEVFWEKWIVI